MADEAKKTEETKAPAKKAAPKAPAKASYDQTAAETVMVRAKEGTQMYDPVTRTTISDAEEGTEMSATNPFVGRHLESGKLIKVK